jgi:hypothetical protein
MPYQANIPNATDLLSKSQADLKNNFIALATIVNPTSKTLTLGNTAAPTVPINTMALYSAAGNKLHIKTSAADIDITTAGKADDGWCLLPCGILMRWGYFAVGHGAHATYTFAIAGFPGFTGVPFNAQVSAYVSGGAGNEPNSPMSITNITNANVTVYNASSKNQSAYVFVTGKI